MCRCRYRPWRQDSCRLRNLINITSLVLDKRNPPNCSAQMPVPAPMSSTFLAVLLMGHSARSRSSILKCSRCMSSWRSSSICTVCTVAPSQRVATQKSGGLQEQTRSLGRKYSAAPCQYQYRRREVDGPNCTHSSSHSDARCSHRIYSGTGPRSRDLWPIEGHTGMLATWPASHPETNTDRGRVERERGGSPLGLTPHRTSVRRDKSSGLPCPETPPSRRHIVHKRGIRVTKKEGTNNLNDRVLGVGARLKANE